MKFLWLFFLSFILIDITLPAQPVSGTGQDRIISRFEFAAGVSRSMNSGYYDFLPKYGYSLGIGVVHAFSPSFELGLRTLWEMKGSKMEQHNYGVSESGPIDKTRSIDTEFNYVTFAIAPVFRTGKKKRIFLGAGGYYSLLKSGTIEESEIDHITNTTTTHRHVDLRNLSTKYDAGAMAFFGYSLFNTKSGYASAQLVYSKGLIDVTDVWNHYQRNDSFMLMVTYNIFR